MHVRLRSSGSLDPAAQREANAWLQHFMTSNEYVVGFCLRVSPSLRVIDLLSALQCVVRKPAVADCPRHCDTILWCKHAVFKSSIVMVGSRCTCTRSTLRRAACNTSSCCDWFADAGASFSKSVLWSCFDCSSVEWTPVMWRVSSADDCCWGFNCQAIVCGVVASFRSGNTSTAERSRRRIDSCDF